MPKADRQYAFTLIELLVVIAIIALLVSILMPSLSAARELARKARCLSNLHSLGVSMSTYLTENDEYFWPYQQANVYWSGQDTVGVIQPSRSPFMRYVNADKGYLMCPSQNWKAQGSAAEPATNYGYNQKTLNPDLTSPSPRRRANTIYNPSALFVFADSGIILAGGSPTISHMIEGPKFGVMLNTCASTHFRHLGMTAALCADSHAAAFDRDGGRFTSTQYSLGFVGQENNPHYSDK